MNQSRVDPGQLAAFQEELTLALRWRGVRGDRIGEVLAEVESHVNESGENPYELFGAPPAYAKRIAAELAGTAVVVPWRPRDLALFVGVFLMGWLFVAGVWAQARGQTITGDIPGWAAVAVAVAMALILWIAGAFRPDRIHDPRTGREWWPSPAWLLPALWVIPLAVVVAVLVTVASLSAGPQEIRDTAVWVVLVVGIIAIGIAVALFRVLRPLHAVGAGESRTGRRPWWASARMVASMIGVILVTVVLILLIALAQPSPSAP